MLFTLKHVFQYGDIWWNYYQKNKDTIRQTVVDNIIKMLSCGHGTRGSAYYTCSNPGCSHSKHVRFTCKGRFCPSCGKKATARWIETQQTLLPQTQWQHITLTMPKTLWRLFQVNRHLLNQLSALAAQPIQEIAKRKGVIPGIFTALHTFGRDLKWNVHIHLSTTLGGLTFDGKHWKALYFKKESLMRMWRYRVIMLLRQAYENGELQLPESLAQLCPTQQHWNAWLDRRYQQRWIIHCARPSKNHSHNVNYLGRYLKRPPLAQSRLRHYDGNIVVFRYLNHKTKQYKNFTCSAEEFIQRFTQHIPEKNFRLIRYYGFLANRVRGTLLNRVYEVLNQPERKYYPMRWARLMKRFLGFDPLECIVCKSQLVLRLIAPGKSTAELHQYHQELALMKVIA